MNTKTQEPPPGWGNDKLSEYLKGTYENAFCFVADQREKYELLRNVVDLFNEVSESFKGLPNKKQIISAFFFSMANSSLLSGIRLATGGQIPDSYKCLRGCLENSVYGFYINENEDGYEKYTTWVNRMDNKKTKQDVRKEFKWGILRDFLKTKNPQLGGYAEKFYDQTIDYGAHPNAASLFLNLEVPDENIDRYKIHCVSNNRENPFPFLFCIKSIAEIGICALMIFEVIFKTRFELTRLSDRLLAVKKKSIDVFRKEDTSKHLIVNWS